MTAVTRGGFLRRVAIALAALAGLDALLPGRARSAAGDNSSMSRGTFCGPHTERRAGDADGLIPVRLSAGRPSSEGGRGRYEALCYVGDLEAVPYGLEAARDAILYELRRDGVLSKKGGYLVPSEVVLPFNG